MLTMKEAKGTLASVRLTKTFASCGAERSVSTCFVMHHLKPEGIFSSDVTLPSVLGESFVGLSVFSIHDVVKRIVASSGVRINFLTIAIIYRVCNRLSFYKYNDKIVGGQTFLR